MNGNNVKQRAQDALHLHQSSFQILGGCYNDTTLILRQQTPPRVLFIRHPLPLPHQAAPGLLLSGLLAQLPLGQLTPSAMVLVAMQAQLPLPQPTPPDMQLLHRRSRRQTLAQSPPPPAAPPVPAPSGTPPPASTQRPATHRPAGSAYVGRTGATDDGTQLTAGSAPAA